MKNKIFVLLLMPVLCFGQNQEWVEIHNSGLDTLTGVVTDSVVRTIDMKKTGSRFLGLGDSYRVPQAIRVVTEITEISSGEGVTNRDAVGISGIDFGVNGFSTKDTLFTAPAGADVWETINILSNPASHYKYSRKAYDSAANTDSVSVRTRIFGIY